MVDIGDFGCDSQLDPPLGQDDRGKIQGHAIGLLDESVLANGIALHAIENGNRAAGQEFRGFAGHGRDRGLGERVSDPLSLERLQSRAEALTASDPVQDSFGGRDSSIDREWVVEREASVRPSAVQIDAKLLEDLPTNLSDRHAQADLVGAADCQGIDHLSWGTGRLGARAARAARPRTAAA